MCSSVQHRLSELTAKAHLRFRVRTEVSRICYFKLASSLIKTKSFSAKDSSQKEEKKKAYPKEAKVS